MSKLTIVHYKYQLKGEHDGSEMQRIVVFEHITKGFYEEHSSVRSRYRVCSNLTGFGSTK